MWQLTCAPTRADAPDGRARQVRAHMTALTTMAIMRAQSNDIGGEPVLQISAMRLTSGRGTTPRYLLALSDGVHTMNAALATQFNSWVESGELRLHSTVRLKHFVVTDKGTAGKKVIIVLNLQLVQHLDTLIGQPIAIESLPSGVEAGLQFESALAAAHRQLAAIVTTREIQPAAPRPPTASRTAAGQAPTSDGCLSRLPGAARLARWLDPLFLFRAAQLLEIDAHRPRLLAAALCLARRVRAPLLRGAQRSAAAAAWSASANPPDVLAALAAAAAEAVAGGTGAAAPGACLLALLSGDVLCEVACHVADDAQLALALSCRALRDATWSAQARKRLVSGAPPATPIVMRTPMRAAIASGVPFLRWAIDGAGCPVKPLVRVAAAHGRLDELAYVLGRGATWGDDAAAAAASAGRLEVLEWARAQKFPTWHGWPNVRDAAREHARALFSELHIHDRLEDDRLVQGPPLPFAAPEGAPLELDDLVLNFFRGMEYQPERSHPIYGPLGLHAMLSVGNVYEQTAAIERLVAFGLLAEVEPEDLAEELADEFSPRYRPVGLGQPDLRRLVYSFFCFGAHARDRVGQTLESLFRWARGLGASDDELRLIVDEFIGDGFMYSTIDDEHFAATL